MTRLTKLTPPNLPTAPTQYDRRYLETLTNTLRLFLTELASRAGYHLADFPLIEEIEPTDVVWLEKVGRDSYRTTLQQLTDYLTIVSGGIPEAPIDGTPYERQDGTWVSAGSGGGVTDHGALTGLADNDHPQYSRLAAAETHTAGKGTQEVTLTSVAGAASITADASNAFYIELTEDTTLTVGTGRTGQVISLAVKQDASGGWTLTLGGSVLEAGSIDTAAGAYSHVSLRWVAAGTWLAVKTSGFA